MLLYLFSGDTQSLLDVNQSNINGWHSMIFAIMGSSGQSYVDIKNYEKIIDYIINNTQVDILKRDNSGKDALYYAHKIYPSGGTIVDLTASKK